MSNVFFPASLPQIPLAGSWSDEPMSNIAAFRPEVGVPITRRRQSGAPIKARGSYNYTLSQRDQFRNFYDVDLEDGSLAFYWNDPISGAQHKWKFDPESGPPSFEVLPHWQRNSEGMFRVQFNLIRLT